MKVSRREFLETTGLGAGGLITSTAGRTSEGTSVASETDILIIGSGAAGLVSAIVAAQNGMRVTVVEKAPGIGGTFLVSGGVVWIPDNHVMAAAGIADNRDNAIRYVTELSKDQSEERLITAFVDNGPAMLRFLEAHSGVQWRVSEVMGDVADYHPTWDGSVPRGRSVEPVRVLPKTVAHSPPGGGGGLLVALLSEAARRQGVQFLTATKAVELVSRDTANGKAVDGVVVEHEGERRTLGAARGVIVASGGFERNREMKRHFLRGPSPYTLGAETNEGDGIKLGASIGADLRNMNNAWGFTVYKADAELNGARRGGASLSAQVERRNAGGICVNRHGQRFCNEASDYASSWHCYQAWENWGENRFTNVPAFQIFDARARRDYTIAGRTAKQDLPPWVIEAPSMDALAAALGIDPAGLARQVERFNRYARDGTDPDFHRGESPYDVYGTGDVHRTLQPLETPPFYGAEVAPADLGTCGGLRVDDAAQVLDVWERKIGNLFAAGNVTGVGGPGALYGGGGGTLGPAMTFGYIAANSIVRGA